MTLRFLLDTNVVSAPVAKQPDSRVVRRLERQADECAISAPVWHELTYGCERLPHGARRDALERYLEDVVRPVFPILPYDEAAAAWHARERARLERAGHTPAFVDGQIAAIGYLAGLVIITRNRKDFIRFRDIAVTDWSQPARTRRPKTTSG